MQGESKHNCVIERQTNYFAIRSSLTNFRLETTREENARTASPKQV